MFVVNGIFHSMVLQWGPGRFVDDGDTMGVAARRVTSPTAPAQRHPQATYLADGALRVKHERSISVCV